MTHIRNGRATAAATALALAAGLVVTRIAPVAAHAGGPRALAWATCPPPEDPSIVRDPRQECATLRVPLSYRSPRGRTIEIHVSRIATAQPGLRRGILVLDAGGPGDTGLDFPVRHGRAHARRTCSTATTSSGSTRAVTATAPRSPATCRPTCRADVADGFPDADGSIDRTVPVARDAARALRRERRRPAAAHHHGEHRSRHRPDPGRARRAPDLVPRVLLRHLPGRGVPDPVPAAGWTAWSSTAPIDPRRFGHEQVRLTGLAVELRLPDFLGWAADRDDRYGLGATPDAVRQTFDTLVARFDASPLPLPDGTLITGNRVRALTFQLLYRDATLPTLAETWQQLLAASAPGAAGTARAGQLPAIPVDNQSSLIYVIQCNDGEWPRDVDTYQRHVDVDLRRYPTVAGVFANIWPCAFWPRRVEAAGPGDRRRTAQRAHRAEPARHRDAVGRRDRPAPRPGRRRRHADRRPGWPHGLPGNGFDLRQREDHQVPGARRPAREPRQCPGQPLPA